MKALITIPFKFLIGRLKLYTDKFRSYNGLVMYRHERQDKSIRFANGKVYINKGFWSYAKERLIKLRDKDREFCVLLERT